MYNISSRYSVPRKNACGLFLTVLMSTLYIMTGADAPIQFDESLQSVAGTAAELDGLKESIQSCYNANFNPMPVTFQDFLESRPTQSVFLHRIWWSKHTTGLALSSFTTLDPNRLQMLEAQCRSFPGGVIAAGIWLPLMEPPLQPLPMDSRGKPQLSPANSKLVANVTARVEEIFMKMEAEAAAAGAVCRLRLMLALELVGDEQMAIIMPINTIRNVAFLALDSPMAMMVDVDLSFSTSLTSKVLSNRTRMEELLWRSHWEHAAWVLPAFDINRNVSSNDKDALVDKVLTVPAEEKTTVLAAMWQERQQIHPFAADRYPLGHNATDYNHWLRTHDEYVSGFQEGYEPWYMAARRAIPPYDVAIRGRYYDKISGVRFAMKRLAFLVLPDIWIVHRPHGYAMSHHNYRTANVDGKWPLEKLFEFNGSMQPAVNLYMRSGYLWIKDVVSRICKNTYKPVVDKGWDNCQAVLPWWRGSFPAGASLRPNTA